MVQLVDTKSVNNTTLLHFLERTVAKHFPEMEEFLAELAAPAEAHRGASHVYNSAFSYSTPSQSTCKKFEKDFLSFAMGFHEYAVS
jgi:hypothetical protein